MHRDRSESRLSTLDAATLPGLDWPKLYRCAVATGCGHCVPVDEEAVAAVDELLARSVPELLVLGELAAAAVGPGPANRCRGELQRTVAGVLRLLDRALIAYGRDRQHQLVGEWRETTAISAARPAPPCSALASEHEATLSGADRAAAEIHLHAAAARRA